MWAYLEVLEVDPETPRPSARSGKVATAVRQFDRNRTRRRWAQGLPPTPDGDETSLIAWLRRAAIVVAILVAFVAGFMCSYSLTGVGTTRQISRPPTTKCR